VTDSARQSAPPYTELFRLDGRRAVVVGAGSGIGREAALALGAHGASVVCVDVARHSVEETARAVGEHAAVEHAAEAVVLDVLDVEAVDQTACRLSPCDVLVFTPATNVRKRLLDCTTDEFDRVVDLNLRASFSLVRAFGRQMVPRGSGSIIGFSSIRAFTVEPGQGLYAATKAGLVQLLRAAAAELAPHGVRVNAIAPGVVETPLTRQISADPDWRAAYAEKSALGRWAQPWELAGAVVYLASDASSFVTGSVLTVDGGWTAVDGRYTPPA
jgi:NAD(P)-dependent dehydrogenase (short-subunit alcohol dehydrogenase family)